MTVLNADGSDETTADRPPVTPAPTADRPPVTPASTAAPTAATGRARHGWRTWRRSRPFWGGLLLTAAGVEILGSVRAPLPVVLHVGPLGLAAYLAPTVMVVCGLLVWFNPRQRMFYSIVGVLMALASWLTSNLGGFFVGLLLGMIGGSLAFAWTPSRHPR
ncbi:DUF6114 domain-containing protein [Planosporangium thailandense]|uniref:DUF6114 domain-containing protein n=1 Tax=Planosporangium thailandense TaxID=765197 RepID=UPI00197B8AB6|nr:DUF6114 domain-containing protein [Planosporangium thailandense]